MNTRQIAGAVALILAAFALATVIEHPVRAQAAATGGVTVTAVTSTAACPSPVVGSMVAIFCPVAASGANAIWVSINGSAYAVLGGAQGPAGPAGPTGSPGPQGPQGAPGVLPANCPTPQLTVPGGLTFGTNCK